MDKKLRKDMKNNFPELLKAVSIVNKYNAFRENHIHINENLELAYQDANSLLFDIPNYYIQEANKILKADYQRLKRLTRRINQYMVVSDVTNNAYVYFVTLTFNDSVLAKTIEKTRRQYVTKFLKSISMSFVANIDYGSNNNREHYHAVLCCNEKLNYKLMNELWNSILNSKTNNSVSFQVVKKNNTSSIKIGKYIAKLSNHAMKSSTNEYCIYSNGSEKILKKYVDLNKDRYVPFDYKHGVIIRDDEELPF